MEDTLQWHPAFFAGIQIEFAEERDNLLFENEHQLGTRPKEIDVLIIKKEKDIPIKKNIGRIFRTYNIIEYKGPQDYISIDDYYKVYAYAYFYKSDTVKKNSIPITEITVTFVSKRYPKKLFEHLKNVQKFNIEKRENGIYILHGNVFPIQVIVTKELSKRENLWLYNLTDDIGSEEEAEELVRIYERHQKDILYESVMNVIVRANHEKFKEVSGMCEALVEIMQPYIDEQVRLRTEEQVKLQVEEQVKARVEEQVKARVEEQVKVQVEKQVEVQVEKRVEEQVKKAEKKIAEREMEKGMKLTRVLLADGRLEDLNRAMVDKAYRRRLCKEFALS